MKNIINKMTYNNSNILCLMAIFCIINVSCSIKMFFSNGNIFCNYYFLSLICVLVIFIVYTHNKHKFTFYEINFGFFRKKAWINQKSALEIKKYHSCNECVLKLLKREKEDILGYIKSNKNTTFYTLTFDHMVKYLNSLTNDFDITVSPVKGDNKEKYLKYIENMQTNACRNCSKREKCQKLRSNKDTTQYIVKVSPKTKRQ